MPSQSMVYRWLDADAAFREQYARAKNEGLDAMADELIAIADESEARAVYQGEEVVVVMDSAAIARNRLRFDARRWYLSKLAPKRYGDRMEVEHTGKVELASTIVNARRRTGSNEPGSDLC